MSLLKFWRKHNHSHQAYEIKRSVISHQDLVCCAAPNSGNNGAPSFEKVVRQAHHEIIDVAQRFLVRFGTLSSFKGDLF